MNGPEEQDDRSFRRQFGAALARAARGRGPCPDADLLVRFVEGGVTDEQARSIRAHVAVCGLCDHFVSRLEGFDNAAEPPGMDWPAIEGRVWRRINPPAPRRSATFFSVLRGRVPAYAGWVVVLALLYPAYLGLFRKPHTTAPPLESAPPAARPIQVIDLNNLRSPAAPVPMRVDDRLFVLNFLVPIRPGRQYTAVIQDEAGNVVSRSPLVPSDASGNCSLLCDRRLFRPGAYRLMVTEQDGREGPFEFRFTL